MNNQDLTLSFNQVVDAIEQALNDFVDTGSDHELFLSGYLHGHFSLAVSQSQLAEDTSVSGLDVRMKNSLQGAFDDGELEAEDQQAVFAMWNKLVSF